MYQINKKAGFITLELTGVAARQAAGSADDPQPWGPTELYLMFVLQVSMVNAVRRTGRAGCKLATRLMLDSDPANPTTKLLPHTPAQRPALAYQAG